MSTMGLLLPTISAKRNQPVVDINKPVVYFLDMETSSDLIDRAADVLGGQRALAEAMGITPQAVNKWKTSRVPAERVLDLERVTGVSRHEIRPDIYPREAVA